MPGPGGLVEISTFHLELAAAHSWHCTRVAALKVETPVQREQLTLATIMNNASEAREGEKSFGGGETFYRQVDVWIQSDADHCCLSLA